MRIGIFLLITVTSLDWRSNQDRSFKTWESICSILSCKSALDKCVQNNCFGLDGCRSCIKTENQNCLRCVDSILNEQYFSINGTQTIICDSVNSLHETTCNFYCRMKEINNGKCENIGNYPLCNCNDNNSTTAGSTATIYTTTSEPITTTTTTIPPTTTTTTTSTITTTVKPIESLLGKFTCKYLFNL